MQLPNGDCGKTVTVNSLVLLPIGCRWLLRMGTSSSWEARP